MEIKKYLKLFYRKIFPDHIYFLKKELSGLKSVLDLGCGPNSSIQFCKVPFSVGVDLFEPYLKESQTKNIHNKYILEDVLKVSFDKKSFDAVILIDVLEHLNKNEGYELIARAKMWASKKVIVFTPNGFIGQPEFDKNPLQVHRSGWNVKEFNDIGFRAIGVNGWKALRGERAGFKKPVLLSRLFSELSQKIVRHYPKAAYHIFAVKDL